MNKILIVAIICIVPWVILLASSLIGIAVGLIWPPAWIVIDTRSQIFYWLANISIGMHIIGVMLFVIYAILRARRAVDVRQSQ